MRARWETAVLGVWLIGGGCGGAPAAAAPTAAPVEERAPVLQRLSPAEATRPPATTLGAGAGAASSAVAAYREAAARIAAAAKADRGAWRKLEHLTDRIGHRLSGSTALDLAIAWAQTAMIADGHQNVRAEPVMVPRWVRGREAGSIVAPVERPLALLALGGSAATRRGGVRAAVVRVESLEELDRRGAAGVKDKIVLFDRPVVLGEDGVPTYGDVVGLRGRGPERASKLGARGALVRSLATASLGTPHTGSTHFDEAPAIPAAAISVEDAALIARLLAAGDEVRVRLELGSRTLPDAPSANVIGELVGRERPDEVVVVGGHIDSWDVGQGAHDDGGGVVAAMQALTILRQLGLAPRRTIRVVLWTNEENGVRGARAYAAAHAAELPRHVLAIEMDTGAYAPRGFRVEASPRALADLAALAPLLAPIGADRIVAGHSGTDVEPLFDAGVPAAGLAVDLTHYFAIHHSAADTLDKVDPADLALDVAALATLAYVVADLPERIGGEPAARRP